MKAKEKAVMQLKTRCILSFVLSVGSILSSTNSVICSKCSELSENKNIYGKTYFSPRSQSTDTTKDILNNLRFFNSNRNVLGSASVSHQETSSQDGLGIWFSFNGKKTMSYGNSGAEIFDINALNFGVTGSGVISFNPKIKNSIAIIDNYFSFGKDFCEIWGRIKVPIVHTNWNLKLSDTLNGENRLKYEDNTVSTTTPDVVYKSLKEAWKGTKSFGVIPSLGCGKIDACQTTTTISSVDLELGKEFINNSCGYFGSSFIASIPVGTTPTAEYLFNAVVGANHSWQLGLTFNGGVQHCFSDCANLGLYFYGVGTHIFDSNQKRLLGLKTRTGEINPGSGFLVLKNYSGAKKLDSLTPLLRAEKILCCDVKVGSPFMFDFSLLLKADYKCCNIGIGWNYWIRLAETMKERCCIIPSEKYGIANLAAGQTTYASSGSFATASKSTIEKLLGIASSTAPSNDGTLSSDSPIFLTDNDVDICTALHPKASSNKVFGFLTFENCHSNWDCFCTIFGSKEFATSNAAVDQWEAGIKVGVSF